MKITVEAGKLASVLDYVRGCVESRTTIPILRHVLITADAGRVTARASNLEVEAVASAPAEIAEGGAIAVPYEVLAGIARRLPKGANIDIAMDGNRVNVTSSRSNYKLGCLDAETFPIMERTGGVEFDISAETLRTMLDSTREFVSTEATRFYLCGVYVEHVDNPSRIVAVATDGHCISKHETEAPQGSEGMPGVIIPSATVKLLSGWLKDVDGDVHLIVSPTRIEARHATGEIVSKLIDGKFPDYHRVIPRKNGAAFSVPAYIIADATARAATVLASSLQASKGVGISRNGSGIVIGAGGRSGHSEEGTEHVEATILSEFPEFGVSHELLGQTLRLFGESEVEIQTDNPSSPILFTSKAKPEITAVVMPMRL